MTGKVISLGQVIVDLTMNVDAVPRAGEDVFAGNVQTQVGASFNTLYAVRRMGVKASHAGVIGTGPWASQILQTLENQEIQHIGKRDAVHDSGFCVALTDANAERTFISTRGAEAYGSADAFDSVNPEKRDVVHVSGYTLVHHTADALLAFVKRTTEHREFTAVFDPSPMISAVDDDVFRVMLAYRPIWSCNEREATLIAQRLAALDSGDSCDCKVSRDMLQEIESANVNEETVAWLCDRLRSSVIVRVGADGAWLAIPGGEVLRIPGFPMKAVDTNGAGDCHTGVLCALLCEGVPLKDAVRCANAASALAVTRRGPATCPDRKEVERLLGGSF